MKAFLSVWLTLLCLNATAQTRWPYYIPTGYLDAVTTLTSASSPYSVTATDSVLLCNAVSGAITINLPAATGSKRLLTIIKSDKSTNACTVTANGADTVNFAAVWPVRAPTDFLSIKDIATASWFSQGNNPQWFDPQGIRANSHLWTVDSTSTSGIWCLEAVGDNGVNGQPDCNVKIIRGTTGTLGFYVTEIDLNTYTSTPSQVMGMQIKNSMDVNYFGTLTSAPVDITYTNSATTCTGTGVIGCGVRFRLADNVGLESYVMNTSTAASTPVLTGGIASSGSQMAVTTANNTTSIDIGTNQTALLSMAANTNTERQQVGAAPIVYALAVNDGAGDVATTFGATNGTSTTVLQGASAALTLAGTTATVTGALKLPLTTVASLPSCVAGLAGALYAVSDATAPTYNAALIGGGTVKVPVFCDGSTWTSH